MLSVPSRVGLGIRRRPQHGDLSRGKGCLVAGPFIERVKHNVAYGRARFVTYDVEKERARLDTLSAACTGPPEIFVSCLGFPQGTPASSPSPDALTDEGVRSF